MEQTKTDRIPVTLLVRFLGGGKTTLVTHILLAPHNQRMAVIVDEFGEVGIESGIGCSTGSVVETCWGDAIA